MIGILHALVAIDVHDSLVLLLRREKLIQRRCILVDILSELLDVLGSLSDIFIEISLVTLNITLLILHVLVDELGLEFLEDLVVDVAESGEFFLDACELDPGALLAYFDHLIRHDGGLSLCETARMHLLTDSLRGLSVSRVLELGGRHDVLALAVKRFADGACRPGVL